MALVDGNPAGPEASETARQTTKTIAEALAFLRTLRSEIMDIVDASGQILLPLKGLAIMNQKKEEAHVLYTGPGSSKDDSSLWKISLLVNERFKEAGFVVETRPLKLHCTLLNTTFRRQRRFPFSFSGIVDRIALDPSIAGLPATSTPSSAIVEEESDFGTWSVDGIHIYKMGSWDRNQRYVSVGNISLKESDM